MFSLGIQAGVAEVLLSALVAGSWMKDSRDIEKSRKIRV